MGQTTNQQLPWPEDTAPVAQGAQAIRALAEAIDTKLGAWTAFTTTANWNAQQNPRGPGRYRINAGMVQLAGAVLKSSAISTNGEIIATNAAWAPYVFSGDSALHLTRGSGVASTASTDAIGIRFWVSSSGALWCRADSSTARIVYLDGLTWRVA